MSVTRLNAKKAPKKKPFDQFWDAYPRKIGKGHARRAFERALLLTDLETMLSALEAYKKHKPQQQDFCHPATWLNGERWEDVWESDGWDAWREGQ